METDLQRLFEVQERVARIARDSGRKSDNIQIVIVTKTISAERISPLLAAGFRCFAENRVQEAAEKWPGLRAQYPDIMLRLIGPLQTNKVRDAVSLFDAIETADRTKLAQEIAKELERTRRRLVLYAQINIGEEAQKAGVAPAECDAFLQCCRDELGLSVSGLMCIPPAQQLAAPYFAQLRLIAARNGLHKLSMGMSADFEEAIQLGATEIRIGSGIFGTR